MSQNCFFFYLSVKNNTRITKFRKPLDGWVRVKTLSNGGILSFVPPLLYPLKSSPSSRFSALRLEIVFDSGGLIFINSLFPPLQAPFSVVHIAGRPPHRDFPLHQVTTKEEKKHIIHMYNIPPTHSHTHEFSGLYNADHQHSRKHTHMHAH